MKINKEPWEFDETKLADAYAREEFNTKTRALGIDHLNISKSLVDLDSHRILKAMLLKESKNIIRIYMVEGFDLSSRDNGSASDTYLKLKCNNTSYDERDNYQLDQANPVFFKKYDFEGVFPGSSPVIIGAWDYDMIFGDELIGETILDVEDRFFSLEWQNLKDKPIEYRQIYHPSSSLS